MKEGDQVRVLNSAALPDHLRRYVGREGEVIGIVAGQLVVTFEGDQDQAFDPDELELLAEDARMRGLGAATLPGMDE